jgi:drug/metabolite transporter (DMT)-like permease
MERNEKIQVQGMLLALTAVIIWSGNFVVARNVYRDVPPVSLNFYRWVVATIVIFPFASRKLRTEWPIAKKAIGYLFFTALAGVSLFNSFVYIAAHYTTAINLALVGTTTSPIIAIILARFFLKEFIGWKKWLGMALCIVGVLILLTKGKFSSISSFGTGDAWMLAAAFAFAVYNTLVKKKPAALSPPVFLFLVFILGVVLMIPYFIWENLHYAPIVWNNTVIGSILFLGIGASVISFLVWNMAIVRIGAGRTALFGNLIPVFSSIEAVFLLNEKINSFHLISFILVATGILIANTGQRKHA